jgi:hypothetical protein
MSGTVASLNRQTVTVVIASGRWRQPVELAGDEGAARLDAVGVSSMSMPRGRGLTG